MNDIDCPKCDEFHALERVPLPWVLKPLAIFVCWFECRQCTNRFFVAKKVF